jgi:hypothetical protein
VPRLNPDHLLEQAERLAAPVSSGAPRQVDLRRAVSGAYYGVFHAILGAAADAFVGAARRTTPGYALVYRSIDHRSIRQLCQELAKSAPSPRVARYAPDGGFGDDLRAFAQAFLELQEDRHAADYDPAIRLRTANAMLAVETARGCLDRFKRASGTSREAFLTLRLFQPR